MAGIGHRGFMGRNKGGIPVPQPGVCTPYPIAIPVQSDILGYYSVFNACDNFQSNNGVDIVVADANRCSYIEDVTGTSAPLKTTTGVVPSIARSCEYVYNGDGDVYWKGGNYGGNNPQFTINTSWRLNTDVKTAIMLVRSSDYSNQLRNRIGFHYPSGIFEVSATGYLRFYSGSFFSSLLQPTENEWEIISVRLDNNVVLGLNKDYEEVLSTTPTISNTDFNFYTANGTNGVWQGDIRELVLYSESISDTDMDAMVDYMKAKWGLI